MTTTLAQQVRTQLFRTSRQSWRRRYKDPKAHVKIFRSAANDDLVWLHLHSMIADDRGRAIVDIFRVKDGKIVEHWDVIQAVPEESANQNTMF